jgi:biopolymer transport protein ExbB
MGYVTAQGRSRLALFLLAGLVAGVLLLFGPSRSVHAQDEEAPAAGEAQPTEGTAAPAETQQTPNIVVHILKSVGLVFGLLLLLLSIALVALIVLLAMELRMGAVIPAGFVEDFTDTVNKRRFREAYEMSKEDGSFLARVLTAGMGRLQYGIEDAREAAFNMVESIKAGKDQLVAYLGTIGTIGPLIGLVTTVYGMILAFMKLSYGGNPRADQLAQDISQALAGTLLGISLAVPAIFFHAFFRNRLTRLSMEAGNVSDDLLTQMYHNSRRPAAQTPTSPPPVDAVNPAGVRPK